MRYYVIFGGPHSLLLSNCNLRGCGYGFESMIQARDEIIGMGRGYKVVTGSDLARMGMKTELDRGLYSYLEIDRGQ